MNINWSVSRNIFFCHEKTQFIKEFIFDFGSVFHTREKDKKINNYTNNYIKANSYIVGGKKEII